ncbi:M3 family oligoendopeptidase [Anaerolineae bacterium CFX9]|nr:M3 family oligoendopeptidase [Anaerolineae bacterium CFX9]
MTGTAVEKVTGAENVVWDLSIFYQGVDDPNIQRDLDKVMQKADAFAAKYRGRVASLDPEEMVDAMTEMEEIQDLDGRIGTFAYLNFATDTSDPAIGALVGRIQEHGAELSQKLMFFELEWKAAPDEVVRAMLASPTLGKYKHPLESELRYKPYTLSEIEEQLLVEKSVTGSAAWNRFFTQLLGASRYEYDGKELTQSQILNLTHDPDREVRRKAADAITAGLKKLAMQTTFIFNVLAQDKASNDKRRGYASWISSRNLSNKATDETVEALVKSVTSNYDIVAQHYTLKRAILGYDELYDYDRYAPLPIADAGREYSWQEAREIVLNAYYAFSPRMGEIAQRFFDENWIHAALLPNKRGGAFASPSVPSAHPFVFVNFTGSARDVMTLAHELGHGLHMYLSAEAQGITGLYTPLTTAEMASVFGEMLVFTDLMNKESDPAVRLAMLAQKLEDSFATVFRQISMNRFEDALHTARRTEGELSTARISELWMNTQKAMFGDSVTLREDYGIWWSYVPHFLNTPGYVYAYAFGELLVLALFNLYRKRGTEFVPQYLDVLAAGDSDYPDKILAKVGVDLTDPAFWDEGLAALRTLVQEEADLAKQVYPEKFGS